MNSHPGSAQRVMKMMIFQNINLKSPPRRCSHLACQTMDFQAMLGEFLILLLWGAWGVVHVLGVLCTLDSGVQSMCMKTDFQSLVPPHPECTPYCEAFSSGDGFAMFG